MDTHGQNRLAREKSPYLLQHANNPIDWWPWCEAAFQRAKEEDKPIFLSVGYSTCHWCHVMAHESFEDSEVADILNRHFVSIKVDREERPDVDSVYMNVTQMLTGSGGWPMSVFMDADKRPFYAGTYFPKQDGRYGTGFITLIKRISALWESDRARLTEVSENIVKKLGAADKQRLIDMEGAIEKGYRQLATRFDAEYGGFGRAPKFPAPHNLMFLLRYYALSGDKEALRMVEVTLKGMYRGGIWDHVGYGFCRYSTDKMWLAPHFEKMLYDNALLTAVYAEAYLVTKDPFYKRVAQQIIEYLQRDMASPDGAFYSAEDADLGGEEGLFYTFTKREIIAVLGEDAGEAFCRDYGVTDEGNFEGRSILNLIGSDRFEDVHHEDALKKLFDYRARRTRPFRDDKILAAWNGLQIYALAYAGRTFSSPEYIQSAQAAADFVLARMVDKGGRLLTRYRDGEARFSGVAEDYAFVIMGLIELYQAGFDVKYLEAANRLNHVLMDDFFEDGALYQAGRHAERLIARPRELYDAALPSANSAAISNFQKLAHLSGAPELNTKAEQIVHFFGADIETMPSMFGFALCGMMMLGAGRQIVLSGAEAKKWAGIINDAYQPFTAVCLADEALARAVPMYKNYLPSSDKTCAYLCEGGHCEAPIYDAQALKRRL